MTAKRKRKPKRGVGRPKHEPTRENRETVKALAGFGVPQPHIASVIGIEQVALRRWYRKELDAGQPAANAVVAQGLFKAAKAGNVTAMIFWLKCRAGWREQDQADIAKATTDLAKSIIVRTRRSDGTTREEPAVPPAPAEAQKEPTP